ncbi:hypothetical protein PsYK624_126390 [Phanerochaete sordida]|uniref:RING-type domain-containing protein n=1 Tax=Phanerochaete sordida TaxID=48140 RepID=A0A9P3GJ06_9APHY|nr:hypothetical protein PsYK624_126390 [Phanerochaete sordida]
MPCGHLYCLACATFWFHQGDGPQPCVMCRKTYRGESIIKLWLPAESQSSHASKIPDASTGGDQVWATAQEVFDACEAAIANVGAREGDEALATALSKTEVFAGDMEAMGKHELGVMNVLKNIRTALSDIKSLLEKRVSATSAPALPPVLPAIARESEISRLRAKLDRDIQELYRESVLAEEAGLRAQHEHEQREDDLRQRLHDVRRRLESARQEVHDMEAKVASLTDEMTRARKGEVRYKKKYYALKQEVRAGQQSARRSPAAEDDSLIVL